MSEDKKKKLPVPVESSDQLLKRYKDQRLIYFGDDLDKLKINRIPTGIFSLDLRLSGGIPEGRLTGFHGEKSTSKSTTSLKTINEFLMMYPEKKVLFVDFEGTYDPVWAKVYIENWDRVIVLEPDYGEQGVDIIGDAANARDIGLIVVDSIAMMVPMIIAEKSSTEDTMGLHPKLVVKLLRKLVPVMAARKKENNPLTVILINQLQSKMDSRSFGDKTITPGGKMKDFMFSLDVKFSFIRADKVEGQPAIFNYKFKVVKNKGGLAKTEGEYAILQVNIPEVGRAGTILEGSEIFAAAKDFGVIKRVGNKWDLFGEEYPNQDAIKLALKNYSGLRVLLREKTLTEGIRILSEGLQSDSENIPQITGSEEEGEE